MLYSISGTVAFKEENFAVIETAGLGLKVFMSKRGLGNLPPAGSEVKLFTHFHLREDGMELYGFPTLEELHFFEMLISVSGVGPKSGLAILEVAELDALKAAIKEGRPDLLSRASGVGRKTAERVIVELRGRVKMKESEATVKKMESDSDLGEVLTELGYRRERAREALAKIGSEHVTLEARLKAALKILGGKK